MQKRNAVALGLGRVVVFSSGENVEVPPPARDADGAPRHLCHLQSFLSDNGGDISIPCTNRRVYANISAIAGPIKNQEHGSKRFSLTRSPMA